MFGQTLDERQELWMQTKPSHHSSLSERSRSTGCFFLPNARLKSGLIQTKGKMGDCAEHLHNAHTCNAQQITTFTNQKMMVYAFVALLLKR